MGAVAMVLLLLALWLQGSREEPVYQGRPASHYFPRWAKGSGEDWDWIRRFPAEAGADAVPFLIAVLGSTEQAKDGWVAANWGRAPNWLTFPLPDPILASARCNVIVSRLGRIVRDPAAMAELVARFDQVPVVHQPQVLADLKNLPGFTHDIRPLVRRVLEHTNAMLQAHVALVLLRGGEAAAPALAEIVTLLELAEARDAFRSNPALIAPVSVALARFGPDAAGALPLLERLNEGMHHSPFWLYDLVVMSIRTNAHGLAAYFEREIIPRGMTETQRFLQSIAPAPHNPWSLATKLDAVPFWMNLATVEGTSRFMNVANGAEAALLPLSETTRVWGVRVLALRSLESFGPNARPAADLAATLLSDPVWAIRLHAAHVLEEIGPAAPDTLPRLIAAMPDSSLHGSLVPLLGRYGAAASNAVPALEAIAGGEYPSHWSNRPAIYLQRSSCDHLMGNARRVRTAYVIQRNDPLYFGIGMLPSPAEPPWTPGRVSTEARNVLTSIRQKGGRPQKLSSRNGT